MKKYYPLLTRRLHTAGESLIKEADPTVFLRSASVLPKV